MDPGEGFISILPIKPVSIGQGTWTIVSDSAQCINLLFYNNSSTDADNCTFNVFLGKGTYTLQMLCKLDSSYGILDVDIDGVEVATHDLYAAAPARNAIRETLGITITKPGIKSIRLRADGKNVASSNYIVTLSCILFQRTA